MLGGRGVKVMPRPAQNDGFQVPELCSLRRSATFLFYKEWQRKSSIDGQRPRPPENIGFGIIGQLHNDWRYKQRRILPSNLQHCGGGGAQ